MGAVALFFLGRRSALMPPCFGLPPAGDGKLDVAAIESFQSYLRTTVCLRHASRPERVIGRAPLAGSVPPKEPGGLLFDPFGAAAIASRRSRITS